jgi:hypothetical protein
LAVTPKPGFRVKKANNSPEDPAVVEVSFGNQRDASLIPKIVPRWDASPEGIPAALVITVDPQVRKAGTYDVLLNLQPKTDPTAPRLKIQIIHAAAKLEVPDKLLIERTDYWPFSVDVDKMKLSVRESSRASTVIDISTQARTSMQGAEMVTGQLVLQEIGSGTPAKPLFPAGNSIPVSYDLSGNFPLGTVTGSIQVFAPELTDPMTLNFEVRSKLTKIYIFLAIVAGLFLSWLLKVYLHNVIDLADARSKGATLLNQVQADWNNYHDREFRKAIEVLKNKLEAALKGRKADVIVQQTSLLDAAWRTALQNIAVHLQTTKTALDDLRKVTETAWILPGLVLRAISATNQTSSNHVDIAHIQKQLVQNDPSSADETIAKLRQQLGGEFHKQGPAWRENVLLFLHRIGEATEGVSDGVLAQFKDALGKTEPQLLPMNASQLVPDPTTAILVDFLRGFETEYRLARELLTELKVRIDQEWIELAKLLGPLPDPNTADTGISSLKKKLDAFSNTILQAASDPKPAIDSLVKQLAELEQAWSDALRELLPTAASAQLSQVQALIQHQDFLGAAAIVATAISASQQKDQNVILGRTGSINAKVFSWPSLAGFLAPSPLTVVSSFPHFVTIPGALAALQLKSEKQIRWAKGVQTLVLAAMFTVFAYSSNSRTFGGTWSDVSTIFFAAFGIDMTVDGLLSKLK